VREVGKRDKDNLIFNGYRVDDFVLVLGKTPEKNEKMQLRQVGAAGFLVRGLATCFYWHEKGVTWDESSRAR
jgi:hypothetical protein